MGLTILVNSMVSLFKTYVGIDYSGAKTPTSRRNGLRVFKATLHMDSTDPMSYIERYSIENPKDLIIYAREEVTDN